MSVRYHLTSTRVSFLDIVLFLECFIRNCCQFNIPSLTKGLPVLSSLCFFQVVNAAVRRVRLQAARREGRVRQRLPELRHADESVQSTAGKPPGTGVVRSPPSVPSVPLQPVCLSPLSHYNLPSKHYHPLCSCMQMTCVCIFISPDVTGVWTCVAAGCSRALWVLSELSVSPAVWAGRRLGAGRGEEDFPDQGQCNSRR